MSYETKSGDAMDVDNPINDSNEEEMNEEMDDNDEYQQEFDDLQEIEVTGSLSPSFLIQKYVDLIQNSRFDEIALKIKENIILKLAKLYAEDKNFDAVVNLLQANNAFFSVVPKAKTAKIVRNVLDIVAKVPDSLSVQIRLCKDVVEWCKVEKRTFLRQRIEAKLSHLLLLSKEPQAGLAMINSLLAELKKLDDKQMLTEGHLTESRIHHALRNIPRAKAALTASRTSAHAIYVTPNLQAELDEMSGILHCEETDYVTAYSYFLEAHDGFDQSNDPRALTSLQYMILCKVLNDTAQEVPTLLSSKVGLKHSGIVIEAMEAVAKAATEKSLEKFQATVNKYNEYFRNDHLMSHNLERLYDKMLTGNLLKIIFPYSVVQIEFVAKSINLPIEAVEKKLSQMVLDHTFAGILDQGKGELIVYDETVENKSYSKSVETIGNLGSVVDALTTRATKLSKGAV